MKFQADRSIEWYKACRVAKGFTRISDKDYNATFALVAKLTTIRLLISLASSHS